MNELLEGNRKLLQENAKLIERLSKLTEKYNKLLGLAMDMVQLNDDLRDFIDEELK